MTLPSGYMPSGYTLPLDDRGYQPTFLCKLCESSSRRLIHDEDSTPGLDSVSTDLLDWFVKLRSHDDFNEVCHLTKVDKMHELTPISP